MTTTQPLSSQRELFDIPKGVTYLNCAYMSPQLHSVSEAGHDAIHRKEHPWELTPSDFFDEVDRLRSRFAELIGGDADGVAVTPSVSYGIATAASLLGPGRGGEVIVLADQFPSNYYAWHEFADANGGQLVVVPRAEDDDWTAALIERIGTNTEVVAVPTCHWTDGTAIDLKMVSKAVRDVGAALVVDGIQTLGAVPMDVTEIEPDVLVTASYKWLLGPFSLGFAWIHPRHREGRPLELGWMTRAGADDFAALVDYTPEFRPGARRYDVGETSNFVLVPMAMAAISQLLDWGVETVSATVSGLTTAIAEKAAPLGFTTPPEGTRSPHLIGLRSPAGVEPRLLAERLAAASVHVSVRGDTIRVSPHVYNTHEDVQRLIDVLTEMTPA